MKLLRGRQLKAALKEVFGPIKREKWAKVGWEGRLPYFNLHFRGIHTWEHERCLHIDFRYRNGNRCFGSIEAITRCNLMDDRLAKVLGKLDKLGITYGDYNIRQQ